MAPFATLRVLRILSVGLLAGAATIALPGTAQAAGTWHTAAAVPGLAALSAGNATNVGSVSCASVGNCSAGGGYTDSGGSNQQAFVVDQVNGTWHNAQEQPGTAALNQTFAGTSSISCFSVGNCSAVGAYANVGYNHFPFVADRVSGTWHAAKEVPGTAALLGQNESAFADVVSCRTGGNCSAGGNYQDSQGSTQAFVANRVNGTWGVAKEVPGTATLNAGGDAGVQSLSCGSAGNCSMLGAYTDAAGHQQLFVANRVSGTWKPAIEIPGTATLNAGSHAEPGALSCGAALNCSAVGTYRDASGVTRAFVANRINGAWHPAFQAPGTAGLSAHEVRLMTLSCPSAGNCTAGGRYLDSSAHEQAFVISEVNGTWGNAKQVPGLAALNVDGLAEVDAVSCASAGNCTAGGNYRDNADHSQAFVADEVNGVWGNALEVPGTGTLNVDGNARVVSLSCRSSTGCSAGGTYVDSAGHLQAFVVTKS